MQTLMGVVGVSALYLIVLTRWQRGFYGLIAYLPFAGAVSIALHLWPMSLLFKDMFFVAPIYIAFAAGLVTCKGQLRGFPTIIIALMLVLTTLTLLQTLNGGVANTLMAAIGLKVWLFYLPLSMVAYVYAESFAKVLKLCRLLAALSLVPAAMAIIQIIMVQKLGYRAAMEASYGELAAQTTQGLAVSQFGAALFGRIPSIFTFPAQFFGFSLSMLVPSYIVWRTDPSVLWRHAGATALIGGTIATFLSGERASFLFTPMIVGIMFLLDRGIPGLAQGLGGALARIIHKV